MKRLACFTIAVFLALYGLCYNEKDDNEGLPTAAEYIDYVADKKDKAVETFCTVKDWLTEHPVFR